MTMPENKSLHTKVWAVKWFGSRGRRIEETRRRLLCQSWSDEKSMRIAQRWNRRGAARLTIRDSEAESRTGRRSPSQIYLN